MQNPMSTEGQLIIVELGAEWPRLSRSNSPKAQRVLVQDEVESPAAFAVRVREQISGLFARGTALTSAVVACSERLDEHAQGARAELARTVALALAGARGGALLIAVSDRNEGRSRAALTGFTAKLAKEWQGRGVRATLHFGDDEGGEQPAPMDPPKRASGSRGAAKDARRVA